VIVERRIIGPAFDRPSGFNRTTANLGGGYGAVGFRVLRRWRDVYGRHRLIRGMGYLSRLNRPGHLDGASTACAQHGTHSFRVILCV
jgi:hypothetical protein